MGELQKRARYFDADIHRRLTAKEAQDELSVWSKDKIQSEDLYVKLSDIEEMRNEYLEINKRHYGEYGDVAEVEKDKWFKKWLAPDSMHAYIHKRKVRRDKVDENKSNSTKS